MQSAAASATEHDVVGVEDINHLHGRALYEALSQTATRRTLNQINQLFRALATEGAPECHEVFRHQFKSLGCSEEVVEAIFDLDHTSSVYHRFTHHLPSSMRMTQ